MQPSGQQFAISLDRSNATRMSCSDANCQQKEHGWATVLDPENAEHVKAARWIEGDSGRRYLKLASESALEYLVNHQESLGLTITESLFTLLERTPAGMLVFLFYPGQQCFRPHLDREVAFVHRTGILVRGAMHPVFQPTGGARMHVRPRDFNEHFNEEADRVNEAVKRG